MHSDLPSSAALLVRARSRREAADRAEAELLETTVEWAALHQDGFVVDPYAADDTVLGGPDPARGADQAVDLAGPGAPSVSEFAVIELAAVLGMTTDSGRRYVGDCLEIAHRLPGVHARVLAGDLQVWRARRIAQATRGLSPDAAAQVDARVAAVAHRVGLTTLDRLVEEARARFDPEEAELRATEARETRRATIDRPAPGEELAGLAHLDATLDLADALDLDAALADLASALLTGGSEDSLDVRRSRALGLLARGQRPGDSAETPPPVCRSVTLYVHTTPEAFGQGSDAPSPGYVAGRPGHPTHTGGLDLCRLDNTSGLVTAEAVREWLAAPGTSVAVKPVIDLRDHVAVDAYEVPERIAERVRLTRPTCAFPHCSRPARRSDLDHISSHIPLDRGGPPGQTGTHGLAPLCRRHHRAKTHRSPTDDVAGDPWHYRRDALDPTAYLWTSPHGHRFRVDPGGTSALTPSLVSASPPAP